jgi:amino acid permease
MSVTLSHKLPITLIVSHALYLIGGPDLDAYELFSIYLAGPFVLIFYLGYEIIKNDWPLCADLYTIDLDANQREDLEDLGDTIRQEKLEASRAPG